MFRYFTHAVATILLVSCFSVAHSQSRINDLQGAWLGSMQTPEGSSLRIGVEIFQKADGSWGGNVASLDQNVRYILVSEVAFQAPNLKVQIAGAPISIQVELQSIGDRFIGGFHEGSNVFPIELERVEVLPEIEREQTPKGDEPYVVEQTRFKNANDNTWLSATVTRPRDKKKHPAVILLAGSGPAHRDAYHSGHRPFKVLADALTRQGFVVLRADKRGVNKSSGQFESATQAKFAEDAMAAIEFLLASSYVEASQINLLGHSEGSLVAAMVASKRPVNSVVSMAGPGLSVLDTLLLQDQTEPAAKGATKAETDILLGFSRRFYDTVLSVAGEEERKIALQSLYDSLTGREANIINKWNNRSGTLNVDFAAQDSFVEMLKEDPAEYWQSVSSAVLVLNGTKDAQVPAEESVAGILKALDQGNNNRVDKKIFSGLNHMFQKADTGATSEYSEIDETISTDVLETIAAWLSKINGI